jgi:pyruvate/2-oxoglutarate dehydrogenase complex dihydrolipoamide acyltransferase (E2) component
MARQATKTRKDSRRRTSNGRGASQKPEKYRFAQNVDGEETVAEREYRTYASTDPEKLAPDADVLLDVPVVKVDSIHLKLEELDAHVALKAEVLDLVKLNVGVDVHLGKVELDIKGVEAQALVKVRLDHVAAIVDRVMTTIDRNPDLVESLGEAVEDVGGGASDALGETGEGVEEVGQGAGQAVDQLGEGAGQAVGDVGEGAGEAASGLGDAAGGLVGRAGQAAGGAGQVLGGVTGGGGERQGGERQGEQPQGDGSGALDPGALSGGQVAKVAAKAMAHEIGSAASDEAKDLGLAATRKVKELGERRRGRRARKRHATPAAVKLAAELDVELADVEGSGAEGRITVSDVRGADGVE